MNSKLQSEECLLANVYEAFISSPVVSPVLLDLDQQVVLSDRFLRGMIRASEVIKKAGKLGSGLAQAMPCAKPERQHLIYSSWGTRYSVSRKLIKQ